MDWRLHLSANPAIMHGALCIRGTRVPVTVVLDTLAAGMPADEIGREYPGVSEEAVQACVAFAAERVRRPLSMDIADVLSRDPERMHGAVVFAGTRVPVRAIFDHLQAGDTLDDFRDGFPSVTRAQAVAALDLAGHRLSEQAPVSESVAVPAVGA